MLAPVIHDARRESRKATTSATSSGRPSLPSGNWVSRNAANAAGLSLLNASQDPPGKEDGTWAHGIDPDAPCREFGGCGRGEVDIGCLGNGIRSPRGRAHAGDRGDNYYRAVLRGA